MSHNAESHNVVLKITVPKRTGRKRKKGTNGPWQGDFEVEDAGGLQNEGIGSHSRLDDPRKLKKQLEDNVGKYQVQAIGMVKHTHRFRGLADFAWDMGRSDFAQRYAEQVIPGEGRFEYGQGFIWKRSLTPLPVDAMRSFRYAPGIDQGPNVDVLPPPIFTHMSLPFNYFYAQNPYVRTTETGETFNATAVKHVGYFIGADDPVPTAPQMAPDMTDPRMVEIIAELETAFADRPMWTRRSLMNQLGGKLRNWNELKKYLNYVAYQFKGGPWRDSVIPYGVDPRTDPKYRVYQTLMFKLARPRMEGQSWHSLRSTKINQDPPESHLFDGVTYHTDGKVWQLCDITDPMLRELIDNAAVRPAMHKHSGWYHGGVWAKLKGIMKTKLVAIQLGRQLTRHDFGATLEVGDQTPTRTANGAVSLPLPDLKITPEEWVTLKGTKPRTRVRRGPTVRIRRKVDDDEPLVESAADQTDINLEVDQEGDEGSDSGSDAGSYNEVYPGVPSYNEMWSEGEGGARARQHSVAMSDGQGL